jgi:hypothetical protein
VVVVPSVEIFRLASVRISGSGSAMGCS